MAGTAAEAAPSVKGALFGPAVRQVRRRLEAGRPTRDQLAEQLKPEDLDYLDGDVVTVLWYPIDAFDRVVRAVWPPAGRRPKS